MGPAESSDGLLVATGLIALACLVLLGLLASFFNHKRKDRMPEEVPDEAPDPLDPPGEAPDFIGPEQRLADLISRQVARHTEIILDANNRLHSEMVELGCKVEVLTEAVRQTAKDLGANESLLRDIIQILNISISETKGVSEKLHKHFDELPKAPIYPNVQRLSQPK